jgi:hypothetical protein
LVRQSDDSECVTHWLLSDRPIVEGYHGVSRVFALDTENIFISSINVLLNRYFSSSLVDDSITYGVGSGTSLLLEHTVVDKSTKIGGSISLLVVRVGEEDGTVGSGSVQSSDTKSELDLDSWMDNSLSLSDESSGAVSHLLNLEVVVSYRASSKISALNTKGLDVSCVNTLLDRKGLGAADQQITRTGI